MSTALSFPWFLGVFLFFFFSLPGRGVKCRELPSSSSFLLPLSAKQGHGMIRFNVLIVAVIDVVVVFFVTFVDVVAVAIVAIVVVVAPAVVLLLLLLLLLLLRYCCCCCCCCCHFFHCCFPASLDGLNLYFYEDTFRVCSCFSPAFFFAFTSFLGNRTSLQRNQHLPNFCQIKVCMI